MYLTQITNNLGMRKVFEFVNSVIKGDVPCISSNNDNSIIVNFAFSNSVLHISDFECIDITTGKIYSRQWRQFMIKHLDKIDSEKTLSNQYIDSLHDYLEQDTIYGPTK